MREFFLPDEDRLFSLPRLDRCPRCGGHPRLYRLMRKHAGILVPTFEVVCTTDSCCFNPAADQTFYSRAQAIRLWRTYCRLLRDDS